MRAPYFGERDLTDSVNSMHCMPMFHAIGIIMTLETVGSPPKPRSTVTHVLQASCGQVLAVPAPKTPPTAPTPDSTIREAMVTNVDTLLTVPAMVEVGRLPGFHFLPLTQPYYAGLVIQPGIRPMARRAARRGEYACTASIMPVLTNRSRRMAEVR